MRRLTLLLPLLFVLSAVAEDWSSLQFMMGTWASDQSSTGDRGSGTGSFSLQPDLQGRVLIRKNFAEYPASEAKPAYRHDDLMVIYRDSGSDPVRAMYFDNEGHVIRYTVTTANGQAVFVSDEVSGQPRFRLTYNSPSAEHLKLKFEIAPPGKDFATYIEASMHRQK
jgi:hypothetical protein